MRQSLDDRERRRIVILIVEGELSYRKIAERFGCGKTTIQDIAAQEGVGRKKRLAYRTKD